jgi:hypothetical protein
MRNLFSDRLAWFGVVVIAAALIVPAGASAEVATIQCKQSYDLDDNHNVVVVYENFQVSEPEDPEEANKLRQKLEHDYAQALEDHPVDGTQGVTPDWRWKGCAYETSPEYRTGSETNGYGGTTTFVRTPDYLRGGKGYAPSGAPKPKPAPAPSEDGAPLKIPALTITSADVVPKGWTPEQLARAREAAAAQAKTLADSKRNEAESQAKKRAFLESLKRRGRAQ